MNRASSNSRSNIGYKKITVRLPICQKKLGSLALVTLFCVDLPAYPALPEVKGTRIDSGVSFKF